MSRIIIDNEKFLHCPVCGENYARYNQEMILLKRVSFAVIDKKTSEITVKCIKCKKEIKIS